MKVNQNFLKKRVSIVIFACLAIPISCSSDDGGTTSQEEVAEEFIPDSEGNVALTMKHDGEDREYIVHLPPNFNKAQSLPVIFSLHGTSTTNTIHMNYTKLNEVADAHNFIIVYPQGLVRSLITGATASHWNSQFGTDVDDVGFIDTLIDRMYTDFNINLKKVYVNGFSNGGFMSYTLGCELSDRIAAIAPVAGLLPILQQSSCDLAFHMPILHFHGTNDISVPIAGIPNFTLSLEDSVRFFTAQYNCVEPPVETAVSDNTTTDNSTVSMFTFTSCEQQSRVVYYIADNAGHTWPDALEATELGITNRDINASAIIWEFFSDLEHPTPRAGVLLD